MSDCVWAHALIPEFNEVITAVCYPYDCGIKTCSTEESNLVECERCKQELPNVEAFYYVSNSLPTERHIWCEPCYMIERRELAPNPLPRGNFSYGGVPD